MASGDAVKLSITCGMLLLLLNPGRPAAAAANCVGECQDNARLQCAVPCGLLPGVVSEGVSCDGCVELLSGQCNSLCGAGVSMDCIQCKSGCQANCLLFKSDDASCTDTCFANTGCSGLSNCVKP